MPSWLRKRLEKHNKSNAAQTNEPNSQDGDIHDTTPATAHDVESAADNDADIIDDDEQGLWKEAFGKLEAEDPDLMKKFKQRMQKELSNPASPESTELAPDEDWKLLKKFVNRGLLKARNSPNADRLSKLAKGFQGI